MPITLDDLRRFAIARSFFPPTTLKRALHRIGFVQADPIRAPARAQDLMLRHRVRNYHAGDLERRYSSLDIQEDSFINYGFVTSAVEALMHPRIETSHWTSSRRKQSRALVEFVRSRGAVHPREVNDHFAHGKVTNYWGGSSSATTQLLELMHYRGLLRVVRRAGGVRIYAVHEHAPASGDAMERRARIDALVDVLVRNYAPLPANSLSFVVRRLRYAVPQWQRHLASALQRAKQTLAHARVDQVDWYWPADERPSARRAPAERVRLLSPFDPIVWDRGRFELFWGWAYRFEAYTPAAKRQRGYYALPLLWRDRVIGWGNVSVRSGELRSEFGYVEAQPPRDPVFARELAAELDRLREFLGVSNH